MAHLQRCIGTGRRSALTSSSRIDAKQAARHLVSGILPPNASAALRASATRVF